MNSENCTLEYIKNETKREEREERDRPRARVLATPGVARAPPAPRAVSRCVARALGDAVHSSLAGQEREGWQG